MRRDAKGLVSEMQKTASWKGTMSQKIGRIKSDTTQRYKDRPREQRQGVCVGE